MKKKIKLILLSIFAFSIVVFNVYAANDNLTNAFYTATRTNATKISTSTNSLVHHNETIPSEYTLALGETYETASSGGCTNRLSAAEKAVYTNSSSTANQTIVNEDACKAKASIKGNYYMKYSKIGTYNGKNIDVKLTIMDFHLNEEYLSTRGVGVVGFYNGTSYATDPNSGRLGVTSIGGDWVKVKYEFFENGTNTPISVKGFTNYWDVDSWQGIHFIDGITGLYASDKTALYYNSVDGKPFVSAPNNYLNTEHYTPVGHIAETFEASTMTRVYSFSRPDASLDSSTPIKFANGGIWHSAVISNAKKSYAGSSRHGKDQYPVVIGSSIMYEVQFTNGDAVNQATVTITDTLSKGLTYNGDAKIGNTSVPLKSQSVDSATGKTTLVWETELEAEESATLTYSAEVNNQAERVVNNSAKVKIGTEEYILAELKNPVPSKGYAQNTQAGSNNSPVKKDDIITYSIKYGNVTNENVDITITDQLVNGIEYQSGSSKINGQSIADPVRNQNDFTYIIENVAPNTFGELTYAAKVDGTTDIVKNAASISYNGGRSLVLAPLMNPVPSKTYGGTSLSDNAGWNHASVKENNNIKYKIELPVADNEVTDTIVVTDVLSKCLTYNNDIQVQNGTDVSVQQTTNADGTTTLVITLKETTVPRMMSQTSNDTGKMVQLADGDGTTDDTKVVITYTAKVSCEDVDSVTNNASCKYDNNPTVKINELENPILKKGKVTVRYLEQGTNRELATQDQETKYYGESYTTSPKTIENFNYVNAEGVTSGTINQPETVVVYYYKAKQGNLIVHHYLKGTTTRLLDDETSTKNYGDSYETSSKESSLPNYDFDSSSNNTSGTINQDETVVTYYYKLKKGNVITKHLEKGTNEELAPSTSATYDYGETYTTSQSSSVPQNYNLDSVSGDVSGEVNKPTTEVIYYYTKRPSNVADSINKTGTDEITNSNALIDYTVNYEAKITDYIGDVTITITDKLPYEIDESASNLAGGTYNNSTRTITWTETRSNYNSYTAEKITITKDIRVKFKNIDKSAKTMVNEVSGKIVLDNGESTVTAEKITRMNIEATLIVHHYLKGTTTRLLDDETSTKNYGDTYTTSSKEGSLPNYDFDSSSDNTSGTINQDETVVTYYYKLKKGEVITKHLEKGTNEELAPSTSATYDYGETYTTSQSSSVAHNYSLDSVSGEVSDVVNKPTTEVIYYYVKKASNITDTIEKTGTSKIDSRNDKVDYTVNYTAKITDYIGPVAITITDRLPYKINQDESTLNGGVYDAENNTITWTESVANYNSATDQPISITKALKLQYTNIGVADKTMVNEVTGRVVLDDQESSVTVEKVTTIEIPGTVTAKYVDEDGKEIADKEVKRGLVGETVNVSAKDIKGYALIKKPDQEVIEIVEGDTECVYVYEQVKYNIITKALTPGGTISGDEVVKEGEDAKRTVKMKADNGYYIKSVTINKKAYKVSKDATSLTLPKFKKLYENKLIEVKFAELPDVIKVPDTASTVTILSVIAGISLVGAGGYFVYKRYKMV